MLFKDPDRAREERKAGYIKDGVDPQSLGQHTRLNSHTDIIDDKELLKILEEKLGNSYQFFEEEDAEIKVTLSSTLTELGDCFGKLDKINSYIINEDCSKLDFNHAFGKEFGYLL